MRRLVGLIFVAVGLAASVPAGAQPGPPPSSSPPPLCGSYNLDPSAPPPPSSAPCTPMPTDAGTWTGRTGDFGPPPNPQPTGPLQIAIIGPDTGNAGAYVGSLAGRLGLVADVGRAARSDDRWRVAFTFLDPNSSNLYAAAVFGEPCGASRERFCLKRQTVLNCGVAVIPQCVDRMISWIQAVAAQP